MADRPSHRQLEDRAVVSCFIFKYPDAGIAAGKKPQVALFRRSARVHTYQHHLAPIAGSIERTDHSPLEAAWRELGEETTLSPALLALELQGKPYIFSDESVGRRWTINPFAFRLKSPTERSEAQIHIDWEHEGWEWHDPLSVRDSEEFGGVPRLAESLRRVFPAYDLGEGAAEILAKGLAELKNDHQSGARQLANNALRIWRDVVAAIQAGGTVADETWWRNIRMAAWHVWKNGRESMGAAVLSALLAALDSIGDPTAMDRDTVLRLVDQMVAERGSKSAAALSAASLHFAQELIRHRSAVDAALKVLTLSESSTIFFGLKHLIQEGSCSVDLRVLESRPLFEGASLAGKLIREQGPDRDLRITVWSDASAALAAADVDIVVIGADRISLTGDVSNKTGSLPAVLAAKHVSPRAKVVVLSDSEKVATPEDPAAHIVEQNDPKQIYRAWEAPYNSDAVRAAAELLSDSAERVDASVNIRLFAKNVFFEWVPAQLIDIYITERGPRTVDDISGLAESLSRTAQRLFGDI